MKNRTVMIFLFFWILLMGADAALCTLGFGLLMSMNWGFSAVISAIIWSVINIIFIIVFLCMISKDAIED